MNPNSTIPPYNQETGYPSYSPSPGQGGMNLLSKKTLILAGTAFIGLIALMVWLTGGRYGMLELTTPSQTPNNKEINITIQQEGKKDRSLTLKPGEMTKIRLSTGNIRVDSDADTLKAIDVVAIESRKTTKLHTPSGEQKSAVQLGTEAQACPLILNDVIYSYNCGGEGVIRKHTRTTFGISVNTNLFDNESFSLLEPYKNGLLGLRIQGETRTLVYIDLAANNIQPIGLPADIQAKLVNGPQIVVTHDPGNPRFVLSFSFDKIYLFKDSGDQKPVELMYGKDASMDDRRRMRSVGFNGDQIIIYTGVGKDPHDGFDESSEDHKKKLDIPGYIFHYDNSGNLVRTLTLPKEATADGIHRLTDNYYVSGYQAGFEVYYAEGDAVRSIYNLADISSWVAHQGKAYIQTNGAIYEFVPGNNGLFGLHSVFSARTIAVSELFSSPTSLLFSGVPSNESTGGLKIYTLSDQAVTANNTVPAVQGEPAYEDFESLVDVGVSAEQIESLKIALGRYITGTNKPVKKIQVIEVGPAIHSRTSDVDSVTFTVSLDDHMLQAKMEYSGRKVIRLYLSERFGSQQQVFDSGNIGS